MPNRTFREGILSESKQNLRTFFNSKILNHKKIDKERKEELCDLTNFFNLLENV